MARSCLYYSKFNAPYANKLCKSYGFDSDAMFTIKSLLAIYPVETNMILFIITSLVFGIWVRISEMPY